MAREVQAAGGSAIAVTADVCDVQQQAAAFERHMSRWRRLDAAVLNAGIGERGRLLADESDDWRATLELDFVAVVEGGAQALCGGWWRGRCCNLQIR